MLSNNFSERNEIFKINHSFNALKISWKNKKIDYCVCLGTFFKLLATSSEKYDREMLLFCRVSNADWSHKPLHDLPVALLTAHAFDMVSRKISKRSFWLHSISSMRQTVEIQSQCCLAVVCFYRYACKSVLPFVIDSLSRGQLLFGAVTFVVLGGLGKIRRFTCYVMGIKFCNVRECGVIVVLPSLKVNIDIMI